MSTVINPDSLTNQLRSIFIMFLRELLVHRLHAKECCGSEVAVLDSSLAELRI
jgi:hypothetical protein